MNRVGIITIHSIRNYGSVLQAYALQRVLIEMGYQVEIIDYSFPNDYQVDNKYKAEGDTQPNEPKWIKMLFGASLLRQHGYIDTFIHHFLNLSSRKYPSVEDIESNPPQYDVYLTGSDQVWSPRHTNGDPTFMLSFAPEDKLKIAYAASLGSSSKIPNELQQRYRALLGRYKHIAVREDSSGLVLKELLGKDVQTVLDPTLLLNKNDWNSIATPKRLIKRPYILCYFLNYSFNAFPYVDKLASNLHKQTGYMLVRVARPPHHLSLLNTKYCIGASPQDFLALVRDAEIVLTTSFHGTAFAINFGKPVITVVKDKASSDNRQIDLMNCLGLDDKILTIKDPFPDCSQIVFDQVAVQHRLDILRKSSMNYLRNALENE